MGGDFEFTVPYTANYELSLAGTQGSSYNSDAGGYGWTLVRDSIKLNYGDVVQIHVPKWNNSYTSTEVSGGHAATITVNSDVVWIAGGGAGTVSNNIAQNGVTSFTARGGEGSDPGVDRVYEVHWHSGNGKSGATHSNSFPTVYSTTLVGGCYGWNGHTHNATGTCPMYHDHSLDPVECRQCCQLSPGYNEATGETYPLHPAGCGCNMGSGFVDSGYVHWGDVPICNHALNAYSCGNYNNTQVLKCGYVQGQILGINNDNENAGACFCTVGWQPTSKNKNNAGGAKFSIRLLEQQELFYRLMPVSNPNYGNIPAYLIINDNRVIYFKRP